MERLASQGGRTTAFRAGAGPDLVVLHSLLTDYAAFDRVVPGLAARHRVTLLNLPGFNGSAAVGGTPQAHVAWLGEALQAFGIAGPATLLGNGFGGTLALAFALERPAQVGRLILCDVAAGFPEDGKQAFRTMAAKVAQGGMGAIAEIAARRVYHDAYIARHPDAVAERREVLLRVEPEAFLAACALLVGIDLLPRCAGLAVPTHVIYGEHDQATPPALNRAIAERVPGATVAMLPGCGHCPPLEAPGAFLAAVSGMLR
jgi:pimeloyl-ACP methyl ester carboxylesterase